MLLFTLGLCCSILAPCMAGGCSCTRGSLGFSKRQTVRGLPVSPVLPHSFSSVPITSYSLAIISNSPRCLSTSRDPSKTIADHRDHRRSSQEAAQPRTASPGLVTAAFQIWEAWYYTWSLVYTHFALTKVP